MKRASRMMTAVLCMAALLPATLQAAEANLDLPVNSAYIWRGQVLNDEPVFQPSVTVSAENGLSFNTWANWNLTDSLGESTKNDFNEIDLTVSYDIPVEVVDVTVGVAEYTYPNQTAEDVEGTAFALPSTRDFFVSVGKEDLPLSPSASVYYDFEAVDAFYGLASISHSIEATKELTFDASLSVGIGDSDYNEYYFGTDDIALNDGNARIGATYAFNESITVSGFAMYTVLLDSDIRDAAKENDAYFNKGDILSGGVSLGYTF